MKFKSQVFTQVSGSVGGLTYSHNQGGLYTRSRTIPVNPSSSAQVAQRANFATAVTRWTTIMTAAERQAWDAYAANVPVTDRLGDSINLTGQQMYIRSATVGLQGGRSIASLDTAPTIFDTGQPITEMTEFKEDVAGTSVEATFGLASGTSAAGELMVQAGFNQNGTVNFYKSPFRFIQADPIGNSVTTLTSTIADADFPSGSAAVGDNIPIRARIIYDDNRLSGVFEGIFTLAANA